MNQHFSSFAEPANWLLYQKKVIILRNRQGTFEEAPLYMARFLIKLNGVNWLLKCNSYGILKGMQ